MPRVTGVLRDRPSQDRRLAQSRAALRRSYDAVAADYAARLGGELAHKPFDRARLRDLAARVAGRGLIGDIGCGPGHVTAFLAACGADAIGLDLSPAMIAEARARHPGCRFAVADLHALGAAPGRFAALVLFYALIHEDDASLAAALAACRAALAPGGPLLAAVHLGEAPVHLEEWWGHPVALTFRFFAEGELEAAMAQAGLRVLRSEARAPYAGVEYPSRRAYVLAERPA
ncbi:MAG: methyltransferase [Elioraea sp.]|nr:MAG: methyltransferase [Elioraea sp.]